MYQAAASYSASRENNYRDLGNSINAFGQYLREIEHRNEKIREENEYRNEKTRVEIQEIRDDLKMLMKLTEKKEEEAKQTEKISVTELKKYIDSRLNEYTHELSNKINKLEAENNTLQKENLQLRSDFEKEKERNRKK